MAYKEIVTKAVIGKGKKTSKGSYEITPENTPNTILGCWVINHNFSGRNNNGSVLVNGSFDINVWYSYDNDSKTAVSTNRYSYDELMNIRLKDETLLTNNSEIIVRSLRQPTVTDVEIIDNKVKMNVEKELGVEIVGETKVRINILEDEDDYDIITDDIESNIEDIQDQIEKEVQEEYLD